MAIEEIKGIIGILGLDYLYKPLLIIFTTGLIYFAIYYLWSKEFYSIKNWKELDSFGKIILIFMLGMLLLLPPILFSINIFLIAFIGYEIFAPHISGKSLDIFTFTLFLSIIFYIFIHILIVFIKDPKELQVFLDIHRVGGGWLIRKLILSAIILFGITVIILILKTLFNFNL